MTSSLRRSKLEDEVKEPFIVWDENEVRLIDVGDLV